MTSLNAIRTFLLKLFPRKKGADANRYIPLNVQAFLAERSFSQLVVWLYEKGTDLEADARHALLAVARQQGWLDKDVEKLEIFCHYCGNNLREALNLSAKYVDGVNFDADIFNIATRSLISNGQFEDAYRLLVLAREHHADLERQAGHNLLAALICLYVNKIDEMKPYLDKAWRLEPDDPNVAQNAYVIYFELDDMTSFENVQKKYHQGCYSVDQAAVSLASVELAQDNYDVGFGLMELRYKISDADRYLNSALFDLQRWHGESLEGKILLISAEQGLGDTIQLVRYLPELLHMGAKQVVMETQVETLSFLQYNFPDVEFVACKYGIKPGKAFDLWTGSMSLPHLLGSTTTNIPGRAGYLSVPPENTEYWHARVEALSRGSKPRVGLAWSGRPSHRADRRRSIHFQRMMDIIRNIDINFFALQTHVPLVHPDNLIDVSEEMVTLADTAALIAEMDLVITIDSSPVHIAGAIGKETWLLLPYRYEWRWGLEGENTHWYESVRVLRQKKHGDWGTLLSEVFDQRLPERMCLKGKLI